MFAGRVKSVFWVSFLISWVIANWSAVYTTIFVEQALILELRKMTKVEYIISFYPTYLERAIYLGIAPLLGSFICVYFVPKVDREYSNWHSQSKNNKELDRLSDAKKHEEKKKEILSGIAKVTKESKEISSELNDEEKWDLEFEKNKDFIFFEEALTKLGHNYYSKRRIRGENPYDIFNPKELLFLDTNELIKIFENDQMSPGPNYTYEITKKGKYFLMKTS